MPIRADWAGVNRLRLQTQGHPRGGDAGNLFTLDAGSVRTAARPGRDRSPDLTVRGLAAAGASEVFTIGALMASLAGWAATK